MKPSTKREIAKNPKRFEAVFIPTIGSEEELVEAAYVAALEDLTPEGKVILDITRKKLCSITPTATDHEEKIMERVLGKNSFVREGTLESVEAWVHSFGGMIHNQLHRIVAQVREKGGIAVIIASDRIDLGVVYLRPATAN